MFPTDIEIAHSTKMLHIKEIAKELDIEEDDLIYYGKYKAKLSKEFLNKIKNNKKGKLILVTAINPTPAGEGKTTTTIGIGQAFSKLGKKSIVCLREPSLGPVFGVKGGATGGGYSQVLPMEDINLHFTSDFHAITSSNNLLASMIDNHIHQGNKLNIDPRTITFKRVLDLNDRALRDIVIGLGGKKNGFPRQDGFQITVASEVMAIFCLSRNLSELKEKLSKIIVANDYEGKPITCADLKAEGAMTTLLKDAILPNLVQTTENTPALIHGGPFANIAHGCNSIIATDTALKISDYTITEAGFGADLGAEKFLDIKCPIADIAPNVIVLVATIRALKYNGGQDKTNLKDEDIFALEKGFPNLKRHYENLLKYNIPVICNINLFDTDTDYEISELKKLLEKNNIPYELNNSFAKGSKGAIEISKKILEIIKTSSNKFTPLYDYNLSIKEKIYKITKEIYHAKDVIYSVTAEEKIINLEKTSKNNLPICIAKTQYSFSDNPDKLGCPENFSIHINDIKLNNGAGFIVCYTGKILTMPGLPKKPSSEKIDIDKNGNIIGLS